MIGKILYRPVREMIWPAMIEPPMMPDISGSISRPAAVGDKPLTICRYSGIAARPPNMPMPRMKFSTEPRRTSGRGTAAAG